MALVGPDVSDGHSVGAGSRTRWPVPPKGRTPLGRMEDWVGSDVGTYSYTYFYTQISPRNLMLTYAFSFVVSFIGCKFGKRSTLNVQLSTVYSPPPTLSRLLLPVYS